MFEPIDFPDRHKHCRAEIERLRTELTAARAKSPIDRLTEAIQTDADYAWSWHCNVAMPFADEGGTHEQANRAAARFMRTAFGVDVTQFPQWKSFPWAAGGEG